MVSTKNIVFSIFVLTALLISQMSSSNPVLGSFIEKNETEATQLVESSLIGSIVINEVMFYPENGQFEWVELKNISGSKISINGFGLTDEDGNWYEFPKKLPQIPTGGIIVVIFDGLGSLENDLDFSDGNIVLHTKPGMKNIFEDEADQVALYDGIEKTTKKPSTSNSEFSAESAKEVLPPKIISYVAWGTDPEEDGEDAFDANIWIKGTYVTFSSQLLETNLQINKNESIGFLPTGNLFTADSWDVYLISQTSLGFENPIPIINTYDPKPGDTAFSDSFVVSWNYISTATSYHFQLSNNDTFISPVVDVIVDTPAYVADQNILPNLYYWRVKTITENGESNWSDPIEISVVEFLDNTNDLTSTKSANPLGIDWQLQRKDTEMLCLNGDDEDGVASWDYEHSESKIQNHGMRYCSRAAISMFVSYYGYKLSQDSIAYIDYRFTDNQLGHGLSNLHGMSDLLGMINIPYTKYSGVPTFESIKNWIDNGQPLIAWVSRYGRSETVGDHFVVIDGYSDGTVNGIYEQKLHILDPWDSIKERPFSTYSKYIYAVYVGPAYTPLNVLQDEYFSDSDSDGLLDFDEMYRFKTEWNNGDSDGDNILDKADMREYFFDRQGNYDLETGGRNFDDDDAGFKETDIDNDNDGSLDGCEDFNFNGIYEPELGETNSFDSTDFRDCPTGWTFSFSSPIPQVAVMEPFLGKLYLGAFQVQSNGHLLVFDGETLSDTGFSELGDQIDMLEALQEFNDKLYIGTRIYEEGITKVRIYSFDGTNFVNEFTDTGRSGYSGIEDMTIHNGEIYASNGAYANGKVYKSNGNGTWEQVGGLVANGSAVRALASYNGYLYAGTGTGEGAYLYYWNGTDWILVANLRSMYPYADGVKNLAVFDNKLFVGFANNVNPVPIVAFDGNVWSTVGSISGCSGARLNSVESELLVGGCDNQIYSYDGINWQIDGLVDGLMLDFEVFNNRIYASSYIGTIWEKPNN